MCHSLSQNFLTLVRMNNKQNNRDQLKQCFIDLAERASELNEPYIKCILLVLAASMAEQSDADLAIWVSKFARIRLDSINDEKEEQ